METSKTGEEADWIELKPDPGMPPKLIAWRQKLSGKAKQEKEFRFYSLYSLVTQLRGWSNYYGYGYPRQAFRNINHYVEERLIRHLNRRSQRKYKLPGGLGYHQQLIKLGLIVL